MLSHQSIENPQQSPEYLKYLASVKHYGRNLEYVPLEFQDENMYIEAIKSLFSSFEFVPYPRRSLSLCRLAYKACLWNFEHIPDQLKGEKISDEPDAPTFSFAAVQRRHEYIDFVPYDQRTLEICDYLRGYHLAPMASLPENNKDKAEKNIIYLSTDGKYIVRDPKGNVQNGQLDFKSFKWKNSEINLKNLEIIIKDQYSFDCQLLKNDVVAGTSRAGHTYDTHNYYKDELPGFRAHQSLSKAYFNYLQAKHGGVNSKEMIGFLYACPTSNDINNIEEFYKTNIKAWEENNQLISNDKNEIMEVEVKGENESMQDMSSDSSSDEDGLVRRFASIRFGFATQPSLNNRKTEDTTVSKEVKTEDESMQVVSSDSVYDEDGLIRRFDIRFC